MRFTVVAFSPIPDIATARQNFDLHDLSDKDVAKVLYHQRKQVTGHSETLTWDQLQIASVSLVHYSLDYVEFGSYRIDQLPERELIGKVFQALSASGRMLSWKGQSLELPLLNFRCMKHRIRQAAYWDAIRRGEQVHTDLHQALCEGGSPSLRMSDLAQRFFFPGMLGHTLDTVWQAYLAGDHPQISHYSDLRALNIYLLALETLSLQGEMSYADAQRARKKLRDYLGTHAGGQPHFGDFLQHWTGE